MKENFDRVMAEIFTREGGYVNDRKDPGGETNMGISRRSYPREDIKNMTRGRASVLYRRDYWNPIRGDDLPPGLDLIAMDATVNSGQGRGVRWLQNAVGAKADGIVGPATIAAAHAVDPYEAVEAAIDRRLAFMKAARHPKTKELLWDTYADGWTNRLNAVREEARYMVKFYENRVETPVAGEPPKPGEKSPLPPMQAWKARSFWAGLTGAVLTTAATLNVDLLGILGMTGDQELVDLIMQFVGVASFYVMWRERKAPTRQLVRKIPKEGKL